MNHVLYFLEKEKNFYNISFSGTHKLVCFFTIKKMFNHFHRLKHIIAVY